MEFFGLQTIGSPTLWLGFLIFVLAMLALDLGVFHRQSHEVTVKEAVAWSAVWVALAGAFGTGVYFLFGTERAMEFTAGYLIEKALAVDNIFVFVVIFAAFAVPAAYQHRVLFWGILGALIMRALFIIAGGAVLAKFHWMMYVFGALLIATGIKLMIDRHGVSHPENNWLVRLARKVIPMTTRFDRDRFFTLENGKRVATPLFLALIAVEITDVIFAVDSIPAVYAVTSDPFIVFTSNIFAILGLRSMYFLLAGIIHRFYHLKAGLATILVFVGAKMAITDFYKVPIVTSLLVIASILAVAIVASLLRKPPAAPTLALPAPANLKSAVG